MKHNDVEGFLYSLFHLNNFLPEHCDRCRITSCFIEKCENSQGEIKLFIDVVTHRSHEL